MAATSRHATAAAGGSRPSKLPRMLVFAVVSDPLDEPLELFVDRRAAEAVVRAWDRDEPEAAGAIHVEPIELEAGTLN
jgi:hypothetical protein